jgi:hypothetical protein
MAAGALLAGAAIPIAAAGTAWADESSDKSGNTAPAIPIAAGADSHAEVVAGVDANGSAIYITGSSAVDTNGQTTTVDTSDTHLANGAPVAAEAHVLPSIPEVHVLPSIPLP